VDHVTFFAKQIPPKTPETTSLETQKKIVQEIKILRAEPKLPEENQIRVNIYGQSLEDCKKVCLSYQSSSGVKETAEGVLQKNDVLSAVFTVKAITSCEAKMALTDYISTADVDVKIPFKRVLLIGQTGSGKTLLAAALQDVELGNKPHTTPRERANILPTQHTAQATLFKQPFFLPLIICFFLSFFAGETDRWEQDYL
jgi:ABC-type glutathione transport system ATPase component